MKKKVFLVIFITIIFGSSSFAQSETDKMLYETFISEKMDLWGGIITEFETNHVLSTEKEKLQLINYYYGYIGYLLGVEHEEVAKKYIKRGEEVVDEIIKKNDQCAAAYAYRSAFSGWRISLNHSLAPILGSRFLYANSHAYALDSMSIQAVIDRGNFYYYAPEIFGGSVSRAIQLYQRALTLMTKQALEQSNWQYFNTKVLLAKANHKAGNKALAINIYKEMLVIEPEFKMVKDKLLPQLLGKL